MTVLTVEERIAKLEARCAAIEKEVELRAQLQEKALGLADRTLSARLESLNEWRSQLTDERDHFMTREAAELCHRSSDDRIKELGDRIAALNNWRVGFEGRVIGTVGVIGMLVIIAAAILRFIPT